MYKNNISYTNIVRILLKTNNITHYTKMYKYRHSFSNYICSQLLNIDYDLFELIILKNIAITKYIINKLGNKYFNFICQESIFLI